MKTQLARTLTGIAMALLVLGTAGCGSLLPKPPVAPTFYTLDEAPSSNSTGSSNGMKSSAATRRPAASRSQPTLAVNVPQAAAGYDSTRIVYTRQAQRLDTYANSVWIDTPAQMLKPMLVAAIESADVFPAVVSTPSAARADIELDTQIVRLQHDFSSTPSRVRFALRVSLVDSVNRRVLASEQFDAAADSLSEDARGGVVAAHAAVRSVLMRLPVLCSEADIRWKADHNDMRAERTNVRP